MKKILIIAFLALTNFISAQDKLNQFDDKGLRQGVWRGYYEESKRLRYEGTFEHGKEVGTFKYYDDTKEVKVIATRDFKLDSNICYTIFFDQKGNKVSEGNVLNKEFQGEWKYYHKESKDIMTTETYLNGKLNGLKKVFYKGNILAEEVPYINSKKEGLAKTFGENGKQIDQHTFKNDLFNGKATYFDSSGNILYEGDYKNNFRVGTWKFYEKGKVVKQVNAEKFSKELVKFENKLLNKEDKLKTQNQPKILDKK